MEQINEPVADQCEICKEFEWVEDLKLIEGRLLCIFCINNAL